MLRCFGAAAHIAFLNPVNRLIAASDAKMDDVRVHIWTMLLLAIGLLLSTNWSVAATFVDLASGNVAEFTARIRTKHIVGVHIHFARLTPIGFEFVRSVCDSLPCPP